MSRPLSAPLTRQTKPYVKLRFPSQRKQTAVPPPPPPPPRHPVLSKDRYRCSALVGCRSGRAGRVNRQRLQWKAWGGVKGKHFYSHRCRGWRLIGDLPAAAFDSSGPVQVERSAGLVWGAGRGVGRTRPSGKYCCKEQLEQVPGPILQRVSSFSQISHVNCLAASVGLTALYSYIDSTVRCSAERRWRKAVNVSTFYGNAARCSSVLSRSGHSANLQVVWHVHLH